MSAPTPRAAFLAALTEFTNAAARLDDAWFHAQEVSPDVGVEAYPFGKDFADVLFDILEWKERQASLGAQEVTR